MQLAWVLTNPTVVWNDGTQLAGAVAHVYVNAQGSPVAVQFRLNDEQGTLSIRWEQIKQIMHT